MPRLHWDRRGILADPISGTAVLEYGATEILPPVGAILKHPACLCRPGRQATAHSRAESRSSRPSKAARGERLTLRWREPDSNHRSRRRGNAVSDARCLFPRQRFGSATFPERDRSSNPLPSTGESIANLRHERGLELLASRAPLFGLNLSGAQAASGRILSSVRARSLPRFICVLAQSSGTRSRVRSSSAAR